MRQEYEGKLRVTMLGSPKVRELAMAMAGEWKPLSQLCRETGVKRNSAKWYLAAMRARKIASVRRVPITETAEDKLNWMRTMGIKDRFEYRLRGT